MTMASAITNKQRAAAAEIKIVFRIFLRAPVPALLFKSRTCAEAIYL
jgi:hypothetical protein